MTFDKVIVGKKVETKPTIEPRALYGVPGHAGCREAEPASFYGILSAPMACSISSLGRPRHSESGPRIVNPTRFYIHLATEIVTPPKRFESSATRPGKVTRKKPAGLRCLCNELGRTQP